MKLIFFQKKQEEYKLSFEKFIKKKFFVMGFILIMIMIVSYLLNPNAYQQVWQNWIYLLGSAIIGVFSALSSISILWQVEKEKEIRKESIQLLNVESEHAVRGLQPRLFGLTEFIDRGETQEIWNLLFNRKALLLSGEAGSGKSGIGVEIYNKCKENKIFVFMLDVRRFSGIRSKNEISIKIGIEENIKTVFSGLGQKGNCLLIIDQLDSVCGTPLGNIVVEFAIECQKIFQLSVLVISRHNEIERTLLRNLLESDFEEIKCKKIHEELVRETLFKQGLTNPSSQLIRLCSNVLLLDLLCSIIIDTNSIYIGEIENEIIIWKKYLEFYLKREREGTGFSENDIYQGLIRMACKGLESDDRSFLLEYPLTPIENRYVSQGIITKMSQWNQRFYFKIEKFQDFLYAFSATNRELNKSQIESEINIIFHKNILSFMVDFYKLGNQRKYELFLREVLSG
jgi:hypothetical protein